MKPYVFRIRTNFSEWKSLSKIQRYALKQLAVAMFSAIPKKNKHIASRTKPTSLKA